MALTRKHLGPTRVNYAVERLQMAQSGDLVPVQATGMDPDKHLSGLGSWDGNIDKLQHLGPAGCGEVDGFHRLGHGL